MGELITERSPVQTLHRALFQFFFAQKSIFLQNNGNIYASFEIRNVYQWSVLTKNVNESLMDYVKYQIFKATQAMFLEYKVV